MDEQPANRNSHQEVLERARNRAQKFERRTAKIENQFALLRLAGTLAALGLFAGVFEKISFIQRVEAAIVFLIFLVALSWGHQRFKEKSQKWLNLKTSFSLSLLRFNRDFKGISEHLPPWHKEIRETIPAGHPYAADLDISSNVFLLLNSCSTRSGSAKLFENLLESGTKPLSLEKIRERHERIRALCRQGSFLRQHEIIRMNTELVSDYLRSLQQEKPLSLEEIFSRPKIASLIAAIVLGCVAWFALLIPSLVKFAQDRNVENLYHMVILYAAIPLLGALFFKPVVDIGTSLRQRTQMLELMLSTIFSLKSGEAQKAFQNFTCIRDDALKTFRNLKMGLNLVSVRNNPILWLALHAIVPYDSIACAILLFNAHKISNSLPIWERESEEFDVLCALSRFLAENSHCNLFEPSHSSPVVQNMGHPLLAHKSAVHNDFALTHEQPMVLLTGSNMSGKSTFLRTLGLNFLLFNMGAPVCAKEFRAPLMRLMCAIRVDDSLADGMSYFYAEVRRLKFILETLESNKKNNEPGLFLVDEIFRGTNNRERFVGSWSILHTLLDSAAFGLVSTHDLALTELETRDTRMRNMHFREHLENDKLVFDYKIKAGPCPTTNALAIMAREGLPVLETLTRA